MTTAIPVQCSYQPSYQVNWELVTLWDRTIPVDVENVKWMYEISYVRSADISTTQLVFYSDKVAISKSIKRTQNLVSLNKPCILNNCLTHLQWVRASPSYVRCGKELCFSRSYVVLSFEIKRPVYIDYDIGLANKNSSFVKCSFQSRLGYQ